MLPSRASARLRGSSYHCFFCKRPVSLWIRSSAMSVGSDLLVRPSEMRPGRSDVAASTTPVRPSVFAASQSSYVRLGKRGRLEDRHDLRQHRLAGGEARFLVAAKRVLDHVDEALVAVGARLVRAVLSALEVLHQIVVRDE